MKIRWDDWDEETMAVYEACVWIDGNINLMEGEYYTTKAEAVKAVKNCKKNYNGGGQLDCFVRYHDYMNDNVKDYNL